ncbi:ABC transporter substrate-binding protein [Ferrovibrio sp.]|uniref:ABC transporter substrate-binding protein n=1 Tax=Ferrovibrio sp. TaxID=1917215 RepID=UPI00262DC203|nr:ABC transporter substrate-binding protein [Ferrovibrio sp.]
MKKRFVSVLSGVALCASAFMMTSTLTVDAFAQATTLKAAVHSPLRIIDPVSNVARITQMHGYMVYDTLFSLDANGVPKPQMVGEYSSSADGKVWTFKLRDGLAFHDGAPVTSEDAIVSIERWSKKDPMGGALLAGGSFSKVDDKTFKLELSKPFGLVLEALGKPGTYAPFIMPARIAKTPHDQLIQDATGSGPYIFKRDEWVPGSKTVYVKNPKWVSRSEPTSFLSGKKEANIERVEWVSLPDANVAMSALQAGEIDYYEYPPMDLLTSLEKSKDVKLVKVDPVGAQGWIRPNHLYPPFNNEKARQALLLIVNQEDYMRALGAPTAYYHPYCGAVFFCGTPLASEVGTAPYKKADLNKAKALLKEAGYNGEKVVVYHPTDVPDMDMGAKVTVSLMRKAGINVETIPMDWGTFLGKRLNKAPPAEGGWNVYASLDFGNNMMTPTTNLSLITACDKATAGWPCDEEMEKLRAAWLAEPDAAKRMQIVNQIQERFYKIVPYIPTGQFVRPVAVRTNISDVNATFIPVFWNLKKN